jgi:hypothetical protein
MFWQARPGFILNRGALDGAFTPINLTGLVNWIDASNFASLNLTGSAVNSIADLSGNSTTLTAVGTNKPIYNATAFNCNYPALYFNSSYQNTLKASGIVPLGTGNELTAFIVCYNDAANSIASARYLAYLASGQSNDSNNVPSFTIIRNSTSVTDASAIRNSTTATNSGGTLLAPHRYILTINSSGVMTLYVDGVASATATASGNWTTNGSAIIGSLNATGQWMDGHVAEAGISNVFANSTKVAQLDAYLAAKWFPTPGATLATWNYIQADVTQSNGNLTASRLATVFTGGGVGARSTAMKSSGKFYYEVTGGPRSGTQDSIGFMLYTATWANDTPNGLNSAMVFRSNGQIYANGTGPFATLGAVGNGANLGCAIDLTNHLAWFRLNGGNWNNNGAADPATGVGGATIQSGTWSPECTFAGAGSAVNDANTANFGQTAYAHAAPSGFGNWTV